MLSSLQKTPPLVRSVVPAGLVEGLCCQQYSSSPRDLDLLSLTLFWKTGPAPGSTLSPQSLLMPSTKIPVKENRIGFILARNPPGEGGGVGWGGGSRPPFNLVISAPHTPLGITELSIQQWEFGEGKTTDSAIFPKPSLPRCALWTLGLHGSLWWAPSVPCRALSRFPSFHRGSWLAFGLGEGVEQAFSLCR